MRAKRNGCPRVSGLLWATGGERFRWLESQGGNGKLEPSSPDLNWLVVLTGLGKKSRCSFGSRLPLLNTTGESMAGIPPVAPFMARGQIEGGLEALTKRLSELVEADHGASQDKPREVNIGAALIADAQTPEVF